MAYTVADVIVRARSLTQDREPEFRYEDDLYVTYVNDAMHEARRMRPDLFIATDGVVAEITICDLELDLAIDSQYFTAVCDYVAGLIGMEDDKFSTEGKPNHLLARFHAKLVGKI